MENNNITNNEHDRKNLSFLIMSSDNVIDDWIKNAGDDDIAYAQELLNSYLKEIDLITLDKKIEKELSRNTSFSEANKILSKFR